MYKPELSSQIYKIRKCNLNCWNSIVIYNVDNKLEKLTE